jgi:FKBP-type peptidyl-prolyl cis-trans isomerase
MLSFPFVVNQSLMKTFAPSLLKSALKSALLGLCLVSVSVSAEEAVPSKADLSAALGNNMGNSLRDLADYVDVEAVIQGLRDGFASKGMSEEKRLAVLGAFQSQYQAIRVEKAQQLSQDNLAKAGEFLTLNGKKEGIQTTTSGLQYRVITQGGGTKPAMEDSVVVKYEGRLISGDIFDSSKDAPDGAISFPLKNVILGFQEALQLMPVGSVYEFFIPPPLAYGEKGAGANIGPNELLIFKLELVSIEAKTPDAAAGATKKKKKKS